MIHGILFNIDFMGKKIEFPIPNTTLKRLRSTFMGMANGKNRTFAVCLAALCAILFTFNLNRTFVYFSIRKNSFLVILEVGARSELDFAVRDCRKRGSKSYYYIV